MEEPVTNVIDSMPERYATVLAEVIGQREPGLLAALRTSEEPSLQQREAVEEFLADALSDNFGPSHQPTERGILIERTIDAFLERWPIDAS